MSSICDYLLSLLTDDNKKTIVLGYTGTLRLRIQELTDGGGGAPIFQKNLHNSAGTYMF